LAGCSEQLKLHAAVCINNFSTDNVQDTTFMFSNATRFNQPVNFNTGNVYRMDGMFAYTVSFNQQCNQLDYGNFSV